MAAASHPSPTPLLASFHFLLMFVIYSGRNLGAFLIKNRARNTAQIGKWNCGHFVCAGHPPFFSFFYLPGRLADKLRDKSEFWYKNFVENILRHPEHRIHPAERAGSAGSAESVESAEFRLLCLLHLGHVFINVDSNNTSDCNITALWIIEPVSQHFMCTCLKGGGIKFRASITRHKYSEGDVEGAGQLSTSPPC